MPFSDHSVGSGLGFLYFPSHRLPCRIRKQNSHIPCSRSPRGVDLTVTEIPSLCRSQHRSAYATHIYGSPGLNAYLVPIECGPEPLCPLERGTAVDRPLAGGRGTSCHGGLGALVPLAHASWQPVPESIISPPPVEKDLAKAIGWTGYASRSGDKARYKMLNQSRRRLWPCEKQTMIIWPSLKLLQSCRSGHRFGLVNSLILS